ncbi:N-acetylmuramoyl-L-alanine amidase, partial [Acinetobacter baumannii]
RVLRDKLKATGRYRVVMTRDRDIFIPLGDRVRIAREHNGALFVSIHADSISGAQDNARGVTVYTLSDRASDADSARLAER